MRLILLILGLVLPLTRAATATPAAALAPREIRAIWVTRGEYHSADDVRQIVDNAASLNFNVILFQVRGNGTVFYESKIEPWAFELTSRDPATTGKDPGWDPLAVAIDAAKKRGIELHAWVNVYPAWRSQRFPPKDSKQLWWSHPEWFMHDAAGERMIPRDRRVNPKFADWYSFLTPGVPEVQKYLADICEELVTNYDVDGLHYDYIRYPREITEVKPAFRARAKKLGNWSYDPVSLKRFTRETGAATPDEDPERWIDWRAEQVTATVKTIADRVRPIRKPLIISAAVGADPEDSRRSKAQDYLRWMRDGTVDGVFLMGYTDDLERFEKQVGGVNAARPGKGFVAAGIGLRSSPDVVLNQIAITRKLKLDGFCGFSYGALFRASSEANAGPLADELKAGPLAASAAVPWRK